MDRLESWMLSVKRKTLARTPKIVDALRPAYDAALRVVYGRSGIARTMNGQETIRLYPQYRSIDEYCESEVFGAMRNSIRAGDVVMDIGANIGVFTVLMARWAEKGTVHAFEPSPEAFSALRRHLALNHVEAQVVPVAAAVSDVVGEAVFYAHSRNGENSLNPAIAERIPTEALRVPVVTIDEYAGQHNVMPSFLKIDIEGYEFHALAGGLATIRASKPTMLVEMHAHLWNEIPTARQHMDVVVPALKQLGYSIVPIEQQKDPLAETGHVLIQCTSTGN